MMDAQVLYHCFDFHAECEKNSDPAMDFLKREVFPGVRE